MAEISKIQPIGSSTQYDLNALKIKINDTAAPSSATTYRIICCNANSGYAETNTTSSFGLYRNSTSNFIVIGNNTIQGGITLHKGNGKYIDIVPGSLTANRTIAFPDAGGTVLLANGTGATSQFLRGDNTWDNTLAGNFYANTITATNTTTNGAQFAMRFSDKSYNTYGLIWTMREANKGGRIAFRHYTENTSGTYNGYSESYCLPSVTSGRTNNVMYNILTSKDYTDYVIPKTGGTYTGGIKVPYNITIYASNMTKGTAPSSTAYNGIYFTDKSIDNSHPGGRMALLENSYDTSRTNKINLGIYSPIAGSSSTNRVIYVSCNSSGTFSAGANCAFYGAVWNDYAEFRETKETIEPGRCIREIGDDTLELTTQRLQAGCEIVSDTFGFAIGKTEKCQTPTATSGRVLAYPYEDRELLRDHIGEPVCSGPNGTISLMTHEEEKEWPSRIIGTISAIPDYEIWYAELEEDPIEIKVNGRIWIRIR